MVESVTLCVWCKMVENDSFLKAFSVLTKFTQTFGFNNFSVPQKRTVHDKLLMKPQNKLIVGFRATSFIVIIIASNILMSRAARPTTTFSIPVFMGRLLNIFGFILFGLNLAIELIHHRKIYFIVSAMCDFDLVVGLF